MQRPDDALLAPLVYEVRCALGMSRHEFWQAVGSSFRTVGRWERGQATPGDAHLEAMARLVYPHDRELAARVASMMLETLVSLGIEQPPPAAPPPLPPPRPSASTEDLTEIVVCAAAEACHGTPADQRAPLLAAFGVARRFGLAYEDVEAALAARLAPAPPPPPVAAPQPRRAKGKD